MTQAPAQGFDSSFWRSLQGCVNSRPSIFRPGFGLRTTHVVPVQRRDKLCNSTESMLFQIYDCRAQASSPGWLYADEDSVHFGVLRPPEQSIACFRASCQALEEIEPFEEALGLHSPRVALDECGHSWTHHTVPSCQKSTARGLDNSGAQVSNEISAPARVRPPVTTRVDSSEQPGCLVVLFPMTSGTSVCRAPESFSGCLGIVRFPGGHP